MMLFYAVPIVLILSGFAAVWLLGFYLFKTKAGEVMINKTVTQFLNKLTNQISSAFHINGYIEQEIAQPHYFEKIKPYIETQVDDFLRIRLLKEMPVIGSLIGEQTIAKLKSVFMEELKIIFPAAIVQYASGLSDNLSKRLLSSASRQQLQLKLSEALQQEADFLIRKLYLPVFLLSFVQGMIIDLLIRFFL